MKMLKRILVIITIFLTPNLVVAQESADNTVKVQRNFLTFVPINLPEEPVPLIVVLHGGFGNAEDMQRVMLLDTLASFKKFIAVYPQGTEERPDSNKRTWNAGGCCGKARRTNVDDVSFLDQMISQLVEKHNIDSDKIYMLGHSNGAMMAYRFVCEKPGVVSSVVALAGTVLAKTCQDNSGLRVKAIHGANDTFINPLGSDEKKKAKYPSLEESGNIIKNAGGHFETMMVPEAGHAIYDLQEKVYHSQNKFLSVISYEFMGGK